MRSTLLLNAVDWVTLSCSKYTIRSWLLLPKIMMWLLCTSYFFFFLFRFICCITFLQCFRFFYMFAYDRKHTKKHKNIIESAKSVYFFCDLQLIWIFPSGFFVEQQNNSHNVQPYRRLLLFFFGIFQSLFKDFFKEFFVLLQKIL